MAAPQLFKLAGRIASRMADKSADSGLPRIEKIFGTPPRVPSPTTIEKIARSDEAFARGPVEYSRYRGPMEEVDEVILDAPLSRPERDYFANISKSGSGFTEKKLSPTEVEFFEDMMREGDPYDFMADIPSAKIRTDAKGNKYLRVQGKKGIEQLYEFLEPSIESGRPLFAKGEMPSQMRDYKWYDRFKDVKEFKHGGGLSSINKPITINGQRHNLAWIRPDEASALKAMGGSGKPGPMGIPSYQYDPSMGDLGEFGGLKDYDPEPPQTTTTSDDSDSGDTTSAAVYAAQQNKMLADADAMERQYGDAYALQRSTDEESPTGYLESYGGGEGITSESLIEKGIPKKLVPYWNALKDRGMTNKEVADYLAGMGAEQLTSMEAAYDTGYSFGGPMGTMGGLTRDMATSYAKKLKLKELTDEIENLDDKLSQEDRTKAIEDIFSRYQDPSLGKFTIGKPLDTGGIMGDLEQTLKDHDLSPHLATAAKFFPGQSLTKAPAYIANAITNLVGHLGTFTTKEGKEFSLRDTGELVERDMAAIPTEDSPELVTEIARAVAPTPEVVAEAGPMKAYQTGLQSIESNEGIENSIQILMNNSGVSESEARRMLGLDVNIA